MRAGYGVFALVFNFELLNFLILLFVFFGFNGFVAFNTADFGKASGARVVFFYEIAGRDHGEKWCFKFFVASVASGGFMGFGKDRAVKFKF